jgi:hypothetical protein
VSDSVGFGPKTQEYVNAFTGTQELLDYKADNPEVGDLLGLGTYSEAMRILQDAAEPDFANAIAPATESPEARSKREAVEGLRNTGAYKDGIITEAQIGQRISNISDMPRFSDEEISFANRYYTAQGNFAIWALSTFFENVPSINGFDAESAEAVSHKSNSPDRIVEAPEVITNEGGTELDQIVADINRDKALHRVRLSTFNALAGKSEDVPLRNGDLVELGIVTRLELKALTDGARYLSSVVNDIRESLENTGYDQKVAVVGVVLDGSTKAKTARKKDGNTRYGYYLKVVEQAGEVIQDVETPANDTTENGKIETEHLIREFDPTMASLLASYIEMRNPLLRKMGLAMIPDSITGDLLKVCDSLPECITSGDDRKLFARRTEAYERASQFHDRDIIYSVMEGFDDGDPRVDLLLYLNEFFEDEAILASLQQALAAEFQPLIERNMHNEPIRVIGGKYFLPDPTLPSGFQEVLVVDSDISQNMRGEIMADAIQVDEADTIIAQETTPVAPVVAAPEGLLSW